ncbi:MAG: PIN domain-containing protein [Alphaproteobacteria bacterium]|jgi:hypothetical protein|nr:PIN domain-containing protein [Alphaproteobacteria bacterium]
MKKQYIYLDASVYHSYKFDVIKNPIQQLTDKQLFINLCSDITKKEVLKNSKKLIAEELILKYPKSLKGILTQSVDSTNICTIDFIENHINKLKNQYFKNIEDYFNNHCEFIDCYSVDTKAIFDTHFNFNPPFSEKKQSEFKDAYVLSSLLNYAKENNIKISVVSNDKDWEDFVNYNDNSKYLTYYQNLPEFLYRDEISYLIVKNYIKDLLKYANTQLVHNLRDYINNHNIEIEKVYDNFTFLEEIDWHILSINFKAGNIEKVEDKSIVAYKVILNITATVLYPDYDSDTSSEKYKATDELIITLSNNKITKTTSDSMQYFINSYKQ